jgi:hypothetical protein
MILDSFILRSLSRLHSSISHLFSSSFPSSPCISLLMSFTATLIFNGLHWKANHHNGLFPLPSKIWTFLKLCQKNKVKNYYMFITKLQEIWKGSKLDHTSPFACFWSQKDGPFRRWKHMASICFSISTTPSLTKVACFLLVYPCFTAREVVLSLSLFMCFDKVCLATLDQTIFIFYLVEGSIPIPQVWAIKHHYASN